MFIRGFFAGLVGFAYMLPVVALLLNIGHWFLWDTQWFNVPWDGGRVLLVMLYIFPGVFVPALLIGVILED